jgi:hypothetical protein
MTNNTFLPSMNTYRSAYLQHIKQIFLFILLVSNACHAALYPSGLVPLGSDLTSSKQSLANQCQKIEIATLARTFKLAKRSQIQLSCVDFSYLGRDRILQLTFSDNMLDMVQILNIRNVLPDLQNQLTAALYQADVPMLVGSDSFGIQITGFSVHKEMQHMQNAGIPAYDVLRAATVMSARFLGRTASAGTINEGKNAEFVMLAKNPLLDIKNAQAITGVMLKGKWLDRAQLDNMLQQAEDAQK